MASPKIADNKKAQPKIQAYSLPLNQRITIGRSDSCKITIKKPEISSFHAVVYYEDEAFWVLDNNSANGITLNGKSIQGVNKLKFNDLIQIGDYSFRFVGEFDYEEGKKYFLEIFKEKLNESPKTQKKKKSTAGSKSDKKKGKVKGHHLQKLGADVLSNLKNFNLKHKKMADSIKKFALISLLCHLVIIYLLGKYFVDGKHLGEIKEIVVSFEEQKPEIKIPEVQQPDIVEPEVHQDISNPDIKVDFKNQVNSSIDSLNDSSDDVLISDSADTSLNSGMSDIQVGKGNKGTGDASFLKRLIKAKGRFKDIDIRLTLIWDGYSDLDLHAMTPSMETIFHGRKTVGDGVLDIDKNASKPVRNPVENIIWSKAGDGEYTVSVVLYDPRSIKADIPFKIEFKIFGDTYYYKGKAKNDGTKEPLEIVKFACRDGKKYKILKSINDKPVKIIEEELDLVIE